MMIDYIVYHLFNDLASHTHSNYALSSHTHSNYVTSDQVSTIVNNSIESGEIQVSGGGFKEVQSSSGSFVFAANTRGTTQSYTINGNGALLLFKTSSGNFSLFEIIVNNNKAIKGLGGSLPCLIYFTESIKISIYNSYTAADSLAHSDWFIYYLY